MLRLFSLNALFIGMASFGWLLGSLAIIGGIMVVFLWQQFVAIKAAFYWLAIGCPSYY